MRQFRGRDNRGIRNFHAVVRFVLFLQTTQNGDCVFHTRLVHKDLLEAAFKCRILFNVLAVFIKRCCADHMQLAAGQSGFQHIARIHAALGLTGTDHRMDFINKENDLAVGSRNFFQQFL